MALLQKIGGFTSTNGAEIPAFDPGSDRLFVVAGSVVEIYSVSNTGSLSTAGSLVLPTVPPPIVGTVEILPNSVAIKNGIIAVAYAVVNQVPDGTATRNVQLPGLVSFYTADGTLLRSVQVGALPDMLTFTPDGTKVLVANEGEPSGYNALGGTNPTLVDPEGSVSIIDLSAGVTGATVRTATFTSFNSQIDALKAKGVRITGPGATVAQDLEPEYIAVSPDGLTARITLQENNAIAILDIASATITDILPLGVKDHNLPGNGIDPSDRDGGINIRNVPVVGLYQPDAIASFTVGGQTYYITANEGDGRDYPGFTDEIRVGDAKYVLDPTLFPNATDLKNNANLGRLTVSRVTGDTDGDGDIDQIQAFGGRSFSIWDANGKQVFDSGDQLERITAVQTPTLFNSDGTAASFDTRSDNKGPEPEGVAIGVINNRTYAFIGMERTGDVIVYEVTNPNKPVFMQYINLPEDVAPEGLTFVSAADSPTGKPLLFTANEVSKTVAVFEVTPPIRISDIQGAGHISPYNGKTVSNVAGIVTAVAARGFYMQDPNPDASDLTSEGIFVFTNSAPTVAVGDAIEVSGTVTEFRPGGNSNNLTTTEITSPSITKLSSGNPLPAATILGKGGRAIPTQIIDNDTKGNIETGTTTFDPAQDGIDFYESLEGMLVQINNPVTTSPTNDFGEVWVLADRGANPVVPTFQSKGVNSSQTPYMVPTASGVSFSSILTVGDSVGSYKMVGIPDGLGAFDNGNGTFTLLMNHELGGTAGVSRAHGSVGAFVSQWIINKSDLSVVSGSDLIQTVYLWNGSEFTQGTTVFNRFCSADLAPVSAFYNSATGLGTTTRIYLNGEESGPEGRAFAHIVTGANAGTTYQLPYLGRFSWENAVASPTVSDKTVVAGMDDGLNGQVYFYVGTKTNTGTEIDKAGLNNGKLFGIKVDGLVDETNTTTLAPGTRFSLADLGFVQNTTGATLDTASESAGVTSFLRPEDGAWDPSNPRDFYFTTTNSFTGPSRLWRLRFDDPTNPEQGGTIEMVLDGTEGQKMFDNFTIDRYGHILLQEDIGNQAQIGKIWQYDIATDKLTELAQHDPSRFTPGAASFLTQDEESSGIIDAQDILGAGWFLLDVQAHYANGTELVEGGQLLAFFNPDTYNAAAKTARGGSLITPNDFNPERIQIDDNLFSSGTPKVNVGTQLGTIVGVVDYNFSNYEVLPTTAPTVVTPSSLTKEVTPLVGDANQLTVATFNVENLDPGDGAAKFNALANAIVNNLKSPDIISLEEIQDNNGQTNDSVVDASVTYQTLINAIASAGGPTYQYRQINPVDDTNGGEPGGNIRVGFLFNPNRVTFVDRPGGTATSSTTVIDTGNDGIPDLSASPGLIDPTNPAFNTSRKPLVGEFIFNGQIVYVIGNHFNSKGGDQPLFGPNQPPTLSSETQRLQQATIVKDFVQSILTINPNANVVVAGDLNDFEFSNPVNLIESAGLTNLIETLPQNERYTYNFEGNAQTLDHVLVSSNLFKQLNGFDVVHINSEFADQISDHDPSVARFLFNNTPANLILGNTGNNTLQGTTAANIIYGRAGNDKIYGNGGNDILLGEDGNDEIYGGANNDYIDGGNGNDKIYAYGGNNIIYGRAGNDTIAVGNGINFIDGGLGNDTITLSSGQDTITLARGNGIDTIHNYSAGSTRFNLSAGLTFNDLKIIQDGNNTLISAGTEKLAALVGVQASSLTSSYFSV